jgi:3-methylcrotonyl-CoA carboxylase beta subunit
VTAEDLGGADVHTRISGVADHLAENDAARAGHRPPHRRGMNWKKSPPVRCDRPERRSMRRKNSTASSRATASRPYDVREIIARIVDGSDFDEFKALYGTTLVCGFARIHGYPVGIVANNGILFSESALKGAHFIELCAPARHSAGVPAEHHRLHGRPQVRERRHRQGRRQDGHRRRHRQGAEIHRRHRRQLRRRQLRHVRPRLQPALPVDVAERAHLGDGRRTGGRRAGHRQARRHGGRRQDLEREEEAAFKAPIREQYETQGHPYYASARLWDDGIIDPADTRRVLGLGLSAAMNAPAEETKFGIFRM